MVLFPEPESPVNHNTGAADFIRDPGADPTGLSQTDDEAGVSKVGLVVGEG